MAKGSFSWPIKKKAVRKDGLFLCESLIVAELMVNLSDSEHVLTYMFNFESGIFTKLIDGHKLVVLFMKVLFDFGD